MQRAAGKTCRIHTVLQKGVSILLFKVRKWGKKDNVKRSGNNSFFVRKDENCVSVFYTHMGANKKIQGTYFKICLTYFKISQTYFLPIENPPGWCRRPMALRAHIRLPARPENADKTQIRTEATGTHVKQTRESAGFVPLS